MTSSKVKLRLCPDSPAAPQNIRRTVPQAVLVAIFSALTLSVLAMILFRNSSLAPARRLPSLQSCPPQAAPTPPALNMITLATGPNIDHSIIEHNCAMVSRTRHRFIVHTDADKLDQPYCRVCECRLHTPTNCPCPNPVPARKHSCFMCEKQRFYLARLAELGDIVWHDCELAILRDDFLDKFAVYTMSWDFLAPHIPSTNYDPTKYFSYFNSGLFFLRRLPNIDYGALQREMYDSKENSDQKTLTRFVHRFIKNWDSISFRWHCRFLSRIGYDIPLAECFTLHDRHEVDEVLRKLNYTLLKLD